MPTAPDHQHRLARLHAALAELGLREKRDFWLVENGHGWRLRWFDHTTPEQQVQGDELVNRLLNSYYP